MQKPVGDPTPAPGRSEPAARPAPTPRSTMMGIPVVQAPRQKITTETPLPAPEPTRDDLGPLVGRTFGGYEIVSFIGEGPSGAVYRGEDLLGNPMAVKVLHGGLADRARTDQLRAALTCLSDLGHPALQKIYEAGYADEGQFFYVTDELVGCDLETGLGDSGGLAPRKSYEITRAILQALTVAHEAGVVHGGLRPRNVFLIPAERGTAVKVLDFGSARLGGGAELGIVAGLPSYLSPEQLEQVDRTDGATGDAGVTARSDLYSLGVLMHELFSGALPAFRGGVRAALGGRRGPALPPASVDPRLAQLILSLLETDPERRPASAADVLAELDRWADGAGELLDPEHPAVIRRRGPTTASGSIGPDSTIRMSKFDAIALAQETLPAGDPTQAADLDPVHTADAEGADVSETEATTVTRNPLLFAPEGRKTMTQNPTSAPPSQKPSAEPGKDANSSESVEASLEDFISQANASFPTPDGWDLHTGDVELLDDDKIEDVAPRAAAPEAAPTTRITDRTEVVSAPLPAAPPQAAPVSWTQNPLIVGGIVLGAVVVGAAVMFLAIRTMLPAQQPQQLIVAPTAVPAAPAAPVVTALPPAAPAPAAAAPPTAPAPAPTVAAPTIAPAAAAPPVVTALPPAAEPPAPRATAPVKKAEHAKKASVSKKEPVAKKESAPKKEAAPAAKKETKKESKKGSDWVDPFAN